MIINGGRKYTIMILSIVIFVIFSGYVIIADQNEKASTIPAIATGLGIVITPFMAANALQKNKENNNEK